MDYRPLSVILGGIMTALVLACAAALALMGKFRESVMIEE